MGSVGISSIVGKIRENMLRWFGLIMRRDSMSVRVVMKISVNCKQYNIRRRRLQIKERCV